MDYQCTILENRTAAAPSYRDEGVVQQTLIEVSPYLGTGTTSELTLLPSPSGAQCSCELGCLAPFPGDSLSPRFPIQRGHLLALVE